MTSTAKSEWQHLRTTADAWQLWPENISRDALQARCFSWLSIEERAHCESFQTERSRHDFLATRALCRATLSRYTEVDPSHWTFGANVHGKPEIIAPEEFKSLRFNLAHTDRLVICMVSRVGEIGVDVEETARVVDVAQLARHFLSRREQEYLAGLSANRRTDRFFEQWVLKEAYLKGIGTGIASAPERLTINLDENGQPLPIGSWRFFTYRPSETHVAAAAVQQRLGAAQVTVKWLKADDLFQAD